MFSNITKLRITLALIVLGAFGIASLWLLVPPPEGVEGAKFYSPLGTPSTLIDVVLALGSSFLFLCALRNFKKELKPAYWFIGIAQLLLGLLTLVFPYVEYYYLWPNIWWNMSTYLPYLLGSIFMFLGARKFYKILGQRSWVTSISIIAGIILAAWGIHALIPHPVTWEAFKETQYDLFEVVTIVPVVCYAAASYMIFRIRAQVGKEYQKAFGWLAVGLALQMFSTITILVLDLIGYENWYFSSRAYEIPTIVGDIGILAAAYFFNAIGLSYASHLSLWQRLSGAAKEVPSSPGIIVYVGTMVSDRGKIDSYLDPMRFVTAHTKPGEAFTQEDQQALLKVYLDLERYIIEEEPLRSMDKQQLRTAVAKHFNLAADPTLGHTFWPHLPA